MIKKNNILQTHELKFNPFIKFLMLMFSAIFVFASIDTYLALDSTLKLNSIFIIGLINDHFFSILELVIIVLVILFLVRYNKRRGSSKLSKILFFLILVCFTLKMLNPNNDTKNPILGMPLLSDISNYSFIILAYFSLFIDNNIYVQFIKKITCYIGIILTFRIVILYILWFMGRGNYSFGANSTITESDTLFLIAFFQIVFFALYLINKKKKYFILWLVYLLFQIFSYRRSALAVALSANVLSYIFILIKGKSLRNKLILILGVVLFFGAINNIEKIKLPTKYENYVLRFISAIPGMASENNPEFSDSGHWKETSKTFYSAKKYLGFWGYGYRQSYDIDMYLEGQSAVIHNAYIATWAKHGVYMLIFYLFIVFLIFYSLFKLFFIEKIHNDNYYILKISLTFFLLMWFGVLITNPLFIIESIKMEVFWFSILTLMIRLSKKNIFILIS